MSSLFMKLKVNHLICILNLHTFYSFPLFVYLSISLSKSHTLLGYIFNINVDQRWEVV